MTERLARFSGRRPWLAIGAWIAAIVLGFVVIATLYGDALGGEPRVTSATESERGYELLDERFPQTPEDEEVTEIVVVRSESAGVDEPGFQRRLDGFVAALRDAGATNVLTSAGGGEELVSSDGDAVALLVALGPNPDERIEAVVDEVERLDGEPGFDAGITGDWTNDADFTQLSLDDLKEGELFFGAPAALVILLLVFGTVVAGIVPLVLALVSILLALALVGLLGVPFDFSVFVQNMIFGMGLALGIDYALFILSRYREERAEGREELDAIAIAGSTASRAVLFSGMAFVLAMFGLLLVPNTIMRSLAAGAILVGFVSVLAALTLLPAVLGLLGDRVNALRLPLFGRSAGREAGRESPLWGGIVRAVMRRPLASLVLAAGLLVVATIPVLDLETGQAGISTIPDRLPSKQGFILLNDEFPGQTADPVRIVVDGEAESPQVRGAIERLEAGLARNDLFGEPTRETDGAGDTTAITVPVAGDPVSEEAVAAVRDLRSEIVPDALAGAPAEVYVTGMTAENIDYYDVMDRWLPRVFAFVLGLSFLLLTIAFRSIVLAAKAIVLNLLAVGAAYGLLVLVFVKGYGNELFGFQQVDTVEAWVPLFLFAVLFGLSMDYQVFLLSRIRERFVASGDNDRAVAFGVGSTARLITGAALIIIAVFAGFARGDLVMFQQMGFGIAVALFIDATIIRSVLVPASMRLLGRWNWYLPSWLRWLPEFHVEGEEREVRRPAAAAR